MVCTAIVMGRTLPIRETVDLKPLNFIAERLGEDVCALPHSPSHNPKGLLSRAWQEPVTSPL